MQSGYLQKMSKLSYIFLILSDTHYTTPHTHIYECPKSVIRNVCILLTVNCIRGSFSSATFLLDVVKTKEQWSVLIARIDVAQKTNLLFRNLSTEGFRGDVLQNRYKDILKSFVFSCGFTDNKMQR